MSGSACWEQVNANQLPLADRQIAYACGERMLITTIERRNNVMCTNRSHYLLDLRVGGIHP